MALSGITIEEAQEGPKVTTVQHQSGGETYDAQVLIGARVDKILVEGSVSVPSAGTAEVSHSDIDIVGFAEIRLLFWPDGEGVSVTGGDSQADFFDADGDFVGNDNFSASSYSYTLIDGSTQVFGEASINYPDVPPSKMNLKIVFENTSEEDRTVSYKVIGVT